MPVYTFPVQVKLEAGLSLAADAQRVAAAIEEAIAGCLGREHDGVEVVALQPMPGTLRSMRCDPEPSAEVSPAAI